MISIRYTAPKGQYALSGFTTHATFDELKEEVSKTLTKYGRDPRILEGRTSINDVMVTFSSIAMCGHHSRIYETDEPNFKMLAELTLATYEIRTHATATYYFNDDLDRSTDIELTMYQVDNCHIDQLTSFNLKTNWTNDGAEVFFPLNNDSQELVAVSLLASYSNVITARHILNPINPSMFIATEGNGIYFDGDVELISKINW